MKKIYLLLLLISAVACKEDLKIIDKPIDFGELREQLTLEYLESHYGIVQDSPIITPKMVVIHWTAIPTLEKSFGAFVNTKIGSHRTKINTASQLNVSSQFLVDLDGTIYRLMPENFMARHVIGLNHCAIGIENVGGTESTPLTEKQLEANIWLVTYLKNKYEIDYVIGHYEYTNFENHDLWLEKDNGYRTLKTDPGKDFLMKIKSATKELGFKEVPVKE
ncbi:N-acetylmuramoyl-L-alanine amidase [Polaribacter sp. R2A056_3_33]|uniref:peptidoglycan recognition protein family protein n=1 Tax=unclassified Polaribacter TaxID=196858 RepID=UPI001C4FAD0C|nr:MULTISPECIES: peptidoglycan recognition family protein [unclassified Polaribacter]QXP64443.1 N-acetylmuramoyl-L-alanine amidase [Polaribacter sp. HaHaR_3_91]QXP69045.1 N-acetylmuramoyl-L-alanine amidase [Polaribacter sp. R2A056_3_33]